MIVVDSSVLASALCDDGAVEVDVLLERTWQLRENLSAYDAAYVSAAELLGCALVTGDARLAGALGIRCDVVLV